VHGPASLNKEHVPEFTYDELARLFIVSSSTRPLAHSNFVHSSDLVQSVLVNATSPQDGLTAWHNYVAETFSGEAGFVHEAAQRRIALDAMANLDQGNPNQLPPAAAEAALVPVPPLLAAAPNLAPVPEKARLRASTAFIEFRTDRMARDKLLEKKTDNFCTERRTG
jgi:hypothetical protein